MASGTQIFFRLKSPVNSIAGYGFYSSFTLLRLDMAWDAFGAFCQICTTSDMIGCFQQIAKGEISLREQFETMALMRMEPKYFVCACWKIQACS